MEEEKCFRCEKSESIAKLMDAIYGNEIVKICEECALLENIPILRKPSSFQLKEAEKPYTVSERLRRMAGVNGKTETIIPRLEKKEEVRGITLDRLRKPKDYSEILKQREERAKKRNIPLDLVDNHNWYIQRVRRGRKMTLSQLGGIIGESDSSLKMIEDGFLPDDANRVITKIEQFFKISLRKSRQLQEIVRIDKARSDIKAPARILSFNPKSLNELTIHDLSKLKQEKEKIDREEMDKELASKIIWQGKSKGEREKDMVETKAEKQIEQEVGEEKKSKKSFWDIFKSKKKDGDVEDVFVGADVSEIDKP